MYPFKVSNSVAFKNMFIDFRGRGREKEKKKERGREGEREEQTWV